MMAIFALYASVVLHTFALFYGLYILKKYSLEFTHRPCILKNGLDDVEVSYLTIVFSTVIAPVTLYHLMIVFNFNDIRLWDAVYWAALGFLLTLFHIVTNKLMEKVRKDGFRNYCT